MMISTTVTSAIRSRVPFLALLGLVSTLPACSLERRPLVSYARYSATAVLTNGEGNAVPTNSDDPILTGGASHWLIVVRRDDAVRRALATEQWRRYLRRRLELEAATPELRARFGNGPFCVRDVTVTEDGLFSSEAGFPEETAAELPVCDTPSVPAACRSVGDPPALDIDPPDAVDFGTVGIGTTSFARSLTIRNSGGGVLCLALPDIDPVASRDPMDFGVATDCQPLSAEERAAGYVFLRTPGAPGSHRESCSVELTATPTASGPREASLRLVSSDTDRPVARVALSVQGAASTLDVPASVCFNVPIEYINRPDLGITAWCHRRPVTIRNAGGTPVTLRSVSLPAAAEGRWRLSEFAPGRPGAAGFETGVLGPTEALTFSGYLCGTDPAADTELTIASDATPPVLNVPFQSPASGCRP